MRSIFFFFLLLVAAEVAGQKNTYRDSMIAYQKNYVETHEVVSKSNRKYLHFYPVNEQYRVLAKFTKISDTAGFIVKTSGKMNKKFFRYGILNFSLDNQSVRLTIYQSEQLMKTEEYRDNLFIPFTDLTSGEESYAGGRYLDYQTGDIQNNSLLIDFNKAYNPYCAYTTGYNCPIPPRENDLPVAILAGEKAFGKKH